jgi:hypothetical protein
MEVTLWNSFYEASITIFLKPNKVVTRREIYRPKYLKNIDANILKKYWQTELNNTTKRSYTMTKLVSF